MEIEVIFAELLLPLSTVLLSLSLVEKEVFREELGFVAPRTTDGVEFFSAAVASLPAWPVTKAVRVSLPRDCGRRRRCVASCFGAWQATSFPRPPPGGSDLRFSAKLLDFLTGTPDFVGVLFWLLMEALLVISVVALLCRKDFPEEGRGCMPTEELGFSLMTLLAGVAAKGEAGVLRSFRSRVSPLSSLCLLKPPAEMRLSIFSTSMPPSGAPRLVVIGSLEAGDDLTLTLSSPAVTEAIFDLRNLMGGEEELWAAAGERCVLMLPTEAVITLLLFDLRSTPILGTVQVAGISNTAV